MGNRFVRVGWVFCACVFSMLCSGCLGSEDHDDPANPGGNDATDGGASGSCTPFSLDLLFVIDDSESMREEQAALRAQLPKIVTALTTGDLDGDGLQDQPPVEDLHLGVVTADLGAAGLDSLPGCDDIGDDATLQRVGPEQLGTEGCAIEQPLEAALRALSSDGNDSFAATADRQSALGIVVVTDEDDCSVEDPDAFAADSDPSAPPDPNLRCVDRANTLFDPARYVSALQVLRPDSGLVFFGAIVGVPPDLLDPVTRGATFADRRERQERYQTILDDPRMQQQVAPDSTLEGGDALTPSCAASNSFDGEPDSRAYPPRRILEVAREFGSRASLFSICDADFTGVVQPMLDAAARRLQELERCE